MSWKNTSWHCFGMAGEDVKLPFGRRVRLRAAGGSSQGEFAHRIGMDLSYYSSIERGKRNLSLENICLIAKGFGVEPAELLRFDASDEARQSGGTPDKPPPPASRRVDTKGRMGLASKRRT